MEIQELQKRIADIHVEMGKVKDTYAKLEGHLAESQYWLSEKLNAKVAEKLAESEAQYPSDDAVMDSLPQDTEEQVNGETHEPAAEQAAEV